MSRNQRIPSNWYDEAEPAARAGRSARGSTWTGGGLTLAILVVVGVVWIAREPEHEASRARFFRTTSPMGSVAFAPDGQALALGGSDGGLAIQDLSGGSPRDIEAGPGLGGLARGLVYSPDGLTLASGGLGTVVKLWDVASGSLRASLEGHLAPVGSLAFSPDGKTLASGSIDGSVKLWDVANAQELTTLDGHTMEVRGLTFSPDGQTLASGSLDGSVKLWDVASARELAGFQNGGRRVYSLAFAPDGQTLALGLGAAADGVKGQVVLWNPAQGPQAVRVLGLASFAAVAFSPDGQTVAAGGGDRVVKLWNVKTGRELASLAGHEGFIASLAFSPDGQSLATVGQDSLIGLFDLKPAKHRL